MKCFLKFPCENNTINLTGVVNNLRNFPLQCEFKLEHKPRECLEKIETTEIKKGLKFECSMSAKPKNSKEKIIETEVNNSNSRGQSKENGEVSFERQFNLETLNENLFAEFVSLENNMKNTEINKNEIQTLRELVEINKIEINSFKNVFQSSKEIRKYPNYSIVMLGSEKMLKFFDESGRGFDEMANWYLCDGRNETPDLRGRFLTGRHTERSDYNRKGMTGGADQVQLNLDQMPNHTHYGFIYFFLNNLFLFEHIVIEFVSLDNGHKHNIRLITSRDGNHTHQYSDIFHTGYESFSGYGSYRQIRIPNNNIGSWYDKIGSYNVGWEIDKHTSTQGNHTHNLQGYSEASNASITGTGGNQAHENRPLYTVVQFIIYIEK